jgi:putative membrane protein insertion efficiency factor
MTPAASVLAGAVRVYQWTIRPVIGANCRFEPSCSHYAIEALGKHGALRGSALAAKRILRCNPWHEGGDDPVPAPISSSPASSPSPTPGRTAS